MTMQPVWKQRLSQLKSDMTPPAAEAASAPAMAPAADAAGWQRFPASLLETDLALVEARRMVLDIEGQLSRSHASRGADWADRAHKALDRARLRVDELTVWRSHMSAKDDYEQARTAATKLAEALAAANESLSEARSNAAAGRFALAFMEVAQIALPAATYGRILDGAKRGRP